MLVIHRFAVAVSLILALALGLRAADLPEPVLPQGVGVNIHFTRGHTRDLDLIAAAGFKVVRMDFSWTATEPKKGSYDWSAYEELTANLEKRGLRPLYILDYSNALYEETVDSWNPISRDMYRDVASPRHAESIAAFARWSAAAARHFRGRRVIWEIWNEPNIDFWKPRPDVREYTALLLAAGKAIREVDPQATVVAPATSGIPLKFLESLFAAGALDYLDAVSVHPYRPYHKPPESAADEYRALRDLIARHAPAARKQLPIVSGEWGYASHTRGVSPVTQAAYLVRQQLFNLYHGVPLSIWYDWKNDGPDPAEREHNFGTVQNDLSPKPAYRAAATLTRELGGYRIVQRLDAGRDTDFVLLLTNAAGQRKLAAWTLGSPHAVNLSRELLKPVGKVKGVTMDGEIFSPLSAANSIALDVSEAPRYLTLDAAAR